MQLKREEVEQKNLLDPLSRLCNFWISAGLIENLIKAVIMRMLVTTTTSKQIIALYKLV